MFEPTVHVPVSLISDSLGLIRHGDTYSDERAGQIESRLAAVLFTPAASAEPVSIEDMAPGTTFEMDDERWTVLDLMPRIAVAKRVGRPDCQRTMAFIDPSTIRDVTPLPTPLAAE